MRILNPCRRRNRLGNRVSAKPREERASQCALYRNDEEHENTRKMDQQPRGGVDETEDPFQDDEGAVKGKDERPRDKSDEDNHHNHGRRDVRIVPQQRCERAFTNAEDVPCDLDHVGVCICG